MITSKSHGELEGGFFGTCSNGFRFGEYAFPVKSVIKMFQYFAENQNSLAMNLASFGQKVFWSRVSLGLSRICELISETDKFCWPNLLEREFGELNCSGIRMPSTVGVPIRISNDELMISVGEYKLDRDEFQGVTGYTLRGGWFGWFNKKYPDEALAAIKSIRQCNRGLYRDFPLESWIDKSISK
jgi:hypothetical protein